MKLSDMFSTLAENARTYEKRVAEWQDEMTSRNDEMMNSARKWQETAMQRQDEMNRQMRGYFEEAGENVRNQWQAMQSAWEDQFQKMREKGEEMRAAAMKSGNLPEWAEAYAAQMVGFAQKMQDEAANAIAAATEARGKSKGKGSRDA
ncbi:MULTISPECIES: hypothetical protein [Paracoccus]|uniref:Phasin family protein n=1 Tax=Paracoccus aerius TaxID=1915382 RepID=A0ABS1S7M5_9RHOB|nr:MULTISPECIES: hypothetical protein [Paracoccus]MBL3674732.1 hypothetical protein [Paracoccus aerius]QIR84683.1 hypothetical protein FIU66_05355 [Paracoccus sp. AK26]GHG28739.1 hypothetical protein GCM10017322_29130 [Paracoccus aerius]